MQSSCQVKSGSLGFPVRDKHRRIFNSITKKHKGRVLQYYGDGTLSIFNSAIDAVKCGIEMQLGFQKDPSIPVRIGIHTGDIDNDIGGVFLLADIRIAQGRLFDAVSLYEQSLKFVPEQGPVLPGTAYVYLGLSKLYREQGNPITARQHLLHSEEANEYSPYQLWQYRFTLAQAKVEEDQGNLNGALDLLSKAERLYYRNVVPELRPLAALKTQVWIKQGKLNKALAWAREQGLSFDDELSYLREFEHLTLTRVLIARYKSEGEDCSIQDALGLLERLLKAAEEGERTGSVIEILVLQALAHEARGDIPLGLVPLKRALALAEPEGYMRIFVDEGIPMAQLLSEAAAHGIMPDYTGKLLAVFEPEKQKQ